MSAELPGEITLLGRTYSRDDAFWSFRYHPESKYPVWFDATEGTAGEFRYIAAALDEIDRLRAWQREAVSALQAATAIGERHGVGLNYGNHDRLIREAGTA